MEDLISVINKLQDVFNTVGAEAIELPQIVVVGSQSSGKSSVIESIVGRDFLPRGADIVTRRPLILQLIHKDKDEIGDYACFLHTGDKKFTDFNKVKEEIESETEKKLGRTKKIGKEPITLKIFSNKVVNLTLVDTPGITKVPCGDQPQDIEIQTRELIVSYIKNPNSIILAVTPVNNDFVNSESLKLARKYDPDGDRTLAVVTKLDLMDKGTDATRILKGEVIPVKLGIVAVVNRSQKDIIDQKSIQDALKDEADFLKREYPSLSKRNGSPYLILRLNNLLKGHIRKCLPALRKKVSTLTLEHQALLDSFGDPIEDHRNSKKTYLFKVISKFTSAFCQLIEGTVNDIEQIELSGGARICYIFRNVLANSLEKIDINDLSDEQIKTAILNANGIRSTLFVPNETFEKLTKKQISKFKMPCLDCVNLVYTELENILRDCLSNSSEDYVVRFPQLNEKIKEIVVKLLGIRLPETKEMVNNIIDIEMSYINCDHPDFNKSALTDSNNFKSLMVKENKKEYDEEDDEDESEEKQVELMKSLLQNYISIVSKNIHDLIPKIITRYLINFIKDNLQSELVAQLYDQEDEKMNCLLFEQQDIIERRKESIEMLNALDKANKIIEDIDYCN